jgi:FAD dependent oxidoreductase
MSRQLADLDSYDVVVVGGGSAGCSAAVAAARLGRRVLLVERYGFLGGTGTAVLDTFYGFYTPGATSRRVVGGIGWQVIERLDAAGAMLLRPNSYGAGTGVTYNPETLKLVWDELVTTAGVQLLLHALCTEVQRAPEGWRLRLATRSGQRDVLAAWLVDASGDAQAATWAGAASEPVDPRRLQSMTTTFRVVNVDDAQARQVPHARLAQLMREASERGHELPRLEGSIHRTPIAGSWVANMTRVSGRNPLVPEELTEAEIEGRRQAVSYVRFLRDFVPGYRDAALAWVSTQIGIRESRRIIGEYTLTRDDVLRGATFGDRVALCGAPIEDHRAGEGTTWEYLPDGQVVGIPLRCLVPKGAERLLVAGRCLSATHDAHAAVRSIGQCMAMGQAAGTAAALAFDAGTGVRGLDIASLHAALREGGAILDPPAAPAREAGSCSA